MAAGFGGAPKFPPSMVLEFLRRHRVRRGALDARRDLRGDGPRRALRPARRRLRALLRRPGWVVPHFEKMLYDNAQLLGLYARWGDAAGRPGGRARPRTS